jgi:hypothetical protein
MPLLLQRVILGTGPDDRDAIGLDFPALPAPGRGDEPAFYGNRRAGAEIFDIGIVTEPGPRDDLNVPRHDPSLSSRNESPFASRRVRTQPFDEYPLARGVGA